MNPPTVDQIDAGDYKGQPGPAIKVLASDDIEVAGVIVALRDATGNIFEQGPAVRDHGVALSRDHGRAAGEMIVEATARNWPGNAATMSVVHS